MKTPRFVLSSLFAVAAMSTVPACSEDLTTAKVPVVVAGVRENDLDNGARISAADSETQTDAALTIITESAIFFNNIKEKGLISD